MHEKTSRLLLTIKDSKQIVRISFTNIVYPCCFVSRTHSYSSSLLLVVSCPGPILSGLLILLFLLRDRASQPAGVAGVCGVAPSRHPQILTLGVGTCSACFGLLVQFDGMFNCFSRLSRPLGHQQSFHPTSAQHEALQDHDDECRDKAAGLFQLLPASLSVLQQFRRKQSRS